MASEVAYNIVRVAISPVGSAVSQTKGRTQYSTNGYCAGVLLTIIGLITIGALYPVGVVSADVSLDPALTQQFVISNMSNVSRTERAYPLVLNGAVLLNVPFELRECDVIRVELAQRQLQGIIRVVCFWWTDSEKQLQSNNELIWRLRAACKGRLVIFHRDIAPYYSGIVDGLVAAARLYRKKHHKRCGNCSDGRWQHLFADAAPVLTMYHLRHGFLADAKYIWYLEWDVAWSGDLGNILVKLQPDVSKFGFGIPEYFCSNCNPRNSRRWKNCRWSDSWWLTPDSIEHICHGLIQMVWYSPKLVEYLYRLLYARAFGYCEAVGIMACMNQSWCQVQQFRERHGELFGYWSCWWLNGTQKANDYNARMKGDYLTHPIKECMSGTFW